VVEEVIVPGRPDGFSEPQSWFQERPPDFSREERRAHVHVQHADGEAKFWIDPVVELAANFSLKPKQVTEAQKLIEEHINEIRGAWAKHFLSGSH